MKSKYKVTAMVPMQFPVAGNFDSEEAIKTIKDIFEMCRDNGNYADIVFNGICLLYTSPSPRDTR